MAAMVADPEDLVRGRKSRMNKDLGAGIPPKSGNTTGGN
jgi:hypothetical protein